MLRIFQLLVITFFATESIASEGFPDPFGLTWDMTDNELISIGFSHSVDSGGLKIFSSVTTPKPWSKGDSYIALTYKNKLVKVAVNSKNFIDDLYGADGKKNYNSIKDLLTKKYGKPTSSFEKVGRKLYKDADEFYQCLEYSGCGNYLSMFEFKGGTIAVSLNGVRRGEGYLSIGYESPMFSIAKDEIKKGEAESDSEVF